MGGASQYSKYNAHLNVEIDLLENGVYTRRYLQKTFGHNLESSTSALTDYEIMKKIFFYIGLVWIHC
ncbi:unnamed protein product [Absidia cylindrospora]